MSRVGNNPIALPDGVSVDIQADQLVIKGGKGELTTPVPEGVSFEMEDGNLIAKRANDQKQVRAFHGLARALAANAVTGVSAGFKRELEVHGVGYRVQMQGKTLSMQLGFSHPVEFEAPEGIQISAPDQTHIVVEGIDTTPSVGAKRWGAVIVAATIALYVVFW